MAHTPSKTTIQLPQSTPIKTGISTTLPYTTNQKYRIESCTEMGKEMRKYLVGPMSAQQFLDDFFPIKKISSLGTVPSFQQGCYDHTIAAKKEKKAYNPFVTSTQNFLPDFRIVNSSSSVDCNPNSDFPFKIKPDVSIYRADLVAEVLPVTDTSVAEMFIEFKWRPSDDPFCAVRDIQRDGKTCKSFLRETKAADDTLGQITSYAAAHLGSQFRTHVYSVFILKNTARIIRWDRSGAIVTEAIEYNKFGLLAEFFRRFSRAPPEVRGIDRSVSKPTSEETIIARKALELDANVQLVKLLIPNNDTSYSNFITRAPRATFYTPPGRATRGFKAYDISRATLVFVKDSWRIDLPDIQAEGLTYEILKKAHVRNVPECVAYGDILDTDYHATKTFTYSTAPWACFSEAHFVPHRHYRLALDIIGRSLVKFESSYEMVAAVRDALIAHEDAYKAKVLHRDFSPGNIIITSAGTGKLIDWDLSKPLSIGTETPRRATRTGTWQFMSGSLIAYNEPHNFKDDLESTIYILLWVALIYSKCSDSGKVTGFLDSVLDPQPRTGLSTYTTKPEFLKGATFLRQVKFPDRPCFDELLLKLANLFAVRYELPPSSGDIELANNLFRSLESQSDRSIRAMYETLPAISFQRRSQGLLNHTLTINYFNEALRNRSLWPIKDRAEKQDFYNKATLSLVPVIKNSWDTALIFHEVEGNSSDAESEDDEVTWGMVVD